MSPPLPAPQNVVATPGQNSVGLTWDAVIGATSYDIYRSTVAGQLGTLISGPGGGGTPNELNQPSYAGSTLYAQDNFMVGGTFDINNLDRQAVAWHSTQNAIAWYGNMVVPKTGYLSVGFDKSATPITTTAGNQVFRKSGYAAWNGASNAARRRGGVWRWKMQMPSPKPFGLGWVPLLWPTDEVWPAHGEVDWPECYSSETLWTPDVNIHYGDGSANNWDWSRSNLQGSRDMSLPHIWSIAWNPGSDSAGTGSYLRGYIDDVQEWGFNGSDTVSSTLQPQGTHRSGPGTQMIMHGSNAVPVNLRLQPEGYGVSDAQYTAGFQEIKIFWLQVWSTP